MITMLRVLQIEHRGFVISVRVWRGLTFKPSHSSYACAATVSRITARVERVRARVICARGEGALPCRGGMVAHRISVNGK